MQWALALRALSSALCLNVDTLVPHAGADPCALALVLADPSIPALSYSRSATHARARRRPCALCQQFPCQHPQRFKASHDCSRPRLRASPWT
eukprot:scaffold28412_cov17-Tisochrysis_lutea.AAC.4